MRVDFPAPLARTRATLSPRSRSRSSPSKHRHWLPYALWIPRQAHNDPARRRRLREAEVDRARRAATAGPTRSIFSSIRIRLCTWGSLRVLAHPEAVDEIARSGRSRPAGAVGLQGHLVAGLAVLDVAGEVAVVVDAARGPTISVIRFTVRSRKWRSCETRTNPPGYSARNPSSQTRASMSRWLVGSSRSSTSGRDQEQLGQGDPHLPTAGEGPDGPFEVLLHEPESRSGPDGPALDIVAAVMAEALIELRVADRATPRHPPNRGRSSAS